MWPVFEWFTKQTDLLEDKNYQHIASSALFIRFPIAYYDHFRDIWNQIKILNFKIACSGAFVYSFKCTNDVENTIVRNSVCNVIMM